MGKENMIGSVDDIEVSSISLKVSEKSVGMLDKMDVDVLGVNIRVCVADGKPVVSVYHRDSDELREYYVDIDGQLVLMED